MPVEESQYGVQNLTQIDRGALDDAPSATTIHCSSTKLDKNIVIALSAFAAVLLVLLFAAFATCMLRMRARRGQSNQQPDHISTSTTKAVSKEATITKKGGETVTPPVPEPLQMFGGSNSKQEPMNRSLALQSDPPTDPEPLRMFQQSQQGSIDRSLALGSDPPTDPEPVRTFANSKKGSLNRSLGMLSEQPTDFTFSEGLPPVEEAPHVNNMHEVAINAGEPSSRPAQVDEESDKGVALTLMFLYICIYFFLTLLRRSFPKAHASMFCLR